MTEPIEQPDQTDSPELPAYEKLGSFYLGKRYDPQASCIDDEKLLYDAKDLTTHAVCVGMTGSGKTGLCVSLLEEAALDGVPAIIIDPKGDLSNLLLTFPNLSADDFAPWVSAEEAARKQMDVGDYAEKVATTWREGLASWDQDGTRIQRLKEAADVVVYTPGAGGDSGGLPISVLRSFAVPEQAVRDDAEALREKINGAISGLLAMLDIDADPLQSREYILLANIVSHQWEAGNDVDLPALIRWVQEPPFEQVGVLDVNTFYPAKDRVGLAMRINNLLASPGFERWMQGDALSIQDLLWGGEGNGEGELKVKSEELKVGEAKPQAADESAEDAGGNVGGNAGGNVGGNVGGPRLSILSIAHLNDAERMFFVTLLLGEVLSWMRTQPGSSGLRAILYMDEVFGYFPPTANPPSKTPMLTLLKQARAFGLGIVLATQNPVDLDYKGLSNCGTWLLGRLQTQRDKDRVLDGLESAAQHGFDRSQLDAMLSGLPGRVFVMNNVHDRGGPMVFHTRWAMSYLRGPMTGQQIGMLMRDRRSTTETEKETETGIDSDQVSEQAPAQALEQKSATNAMAQPRDASPDERTTTTRPANKPAVEPGVDEVFVVDHDNSDKTRENPGKYQPYLCATVRVHFARVSLQLDHWETVTWLAKLDDAVMDDVWEESRRHADELDLRDKPEAGVAFGPLPIPAALSASYKTWTREFKKHLYREHALTIYRHKGLRVTSHANETEQAFRQRLMPMIGQQQAESADKCRARYATKLKRASEKLRKAEQRVGRETQQYKSARTSAWLTVFKTILSGLFGKRISRSTSTSARRMGYASTQKQDIAHARDDVAVAQEHLAELEQALADEIEILTEPIELASIELEPVTVRMRKSEIDVTRMSLAWKIAGAGR